MALFQTLGRMICNAQPHCLQYLRSSPAYLHYPDYLAIALCTAHNGSHQIHNHLEISDASNKWIPNFKTVIKFHVFTKQVNNHYSS